jgi:hypothetical protein
LVFGDKLTQEEVVLIIEIESIKLAESNYREEDD